MLITSYARLSNVILTMKYRKIPVISPGRIQLCKGFWVGLQAEGLKSGRAYKWNKRKRLETWQLKMHKKVTFSPG